MMEKKRKKGIENGGEVNLRRVLFGRVKATKRLIILKLQTLRAKVTTPH